MRGINLIHADRAGTKSYCLYNAHGDVVQLADGSGNVTKTYDYDAFGNERNPVTDDANPWRYCGEYYDAETGTIYLRARYYQPATGRFDSEDSHWNVRNMVYGDDPLSLYSFAYIPNYLSIWQSSNLYLYCIGNPIRYFDSNGESAAAGATIGGLFGGPAGVIVGAILGSLVGAVGGVQSQKLSMISLKTMLKMILMQQ